MTSRKFWISGLFSLTLLITSCEAVLAAPALFSDLSLAEAKAKAEKENKLLLVDFTAAWCPPCGEMDKTTWENPKVVEWLKNNAVAIQIDVDKEPKISQDLRISAMPSLVVFKNKSVELDRQVGMMSDSDLLKWLDSLKNGVTSTDRLEQSLQLKENQGGRKELELRSQLADSQFSSGKWADSIDNFVWLWQNMVHIDPSTSVMKETFFADEVRELIANYPPARARFAKVRDEAELKSTDDWLLLNDVLGEKESSLKWFDKAKDDPAQAAKLHSLEPQITRMLIGAGRYSDLVPFFKNPIERMEKLHQNSQKFENLKLDLLWTQAGIFYTSYMAAGQVDEAERIAAEAVKLDDSIDMAKSLVFTALDAGLTNPQVIARLDGLNYAVMDDFASVYKVGAAYLKLKKYETAIKVFTRAIEMAPTEPLAFDARVTAYCGLNQFDKAMADANRLLEIYPKSDRAYISRGFIYLKQAKDDLALKELEQAEKINPKNPLIYIDKSAALMLSGKFEQAVTAANKTIEIDSKSAAGYCNRGEANFRLNKNEQALSDLNKSVELGATTCGGENYYFRAQVLKALNKTAESAADLALSQKLGYVPDSL